MGDAEEPDEVAPQADPVHAAGECDDSKFVLEYDDDGRAQAKGYHRVDNRLIVIWWSEGDDAIDVRSVWAYLSGVSGDFVIVNGYAEMGAHLADEYDDEGWREAYTHPLTDDRTVAVAEDVDQFRPVDPAGFMLWDWRTVSREAFEPSEFEDAVSDFPTANESNRLRLPVFNTEQ